MVRIVHVLMLIASLLVCPIRCLGALEREARAPSPKSAQSSCCGHCGHQQQPAAPREDDHPAEHPTDCGCASCLCQGGWVEQPRTDWDDAGDEFVTVQPDLSGRLLIRTFCITAAAERSCHFPPLASGRHVCALTCSLLL